MLQAAFVGGVCRHLLRRAGRGAAAARDIEIETRADGWQVRSIKAQDGCYAADATTERVEVHAVFDPRTLKRLDAEKQDGAG